MSHFRALAAGLMLAGIAWSQVDRARIVGTVTDPSGAVVAGASVTAISKETNESRSASSNANGQYEIPDLPIGHYTVSIAKAGFKTLQVENIQLFVGETRTLDAHLQLANLPSQQVVVIAEATPLDRSSPEASNVIQSQEIRAIPLNGRNWSGLVQLAPLATGSNTRSARFAGRAPDDNNLTLDGVDITGIQEHPQKANQNLTISTEAIAEFHVQSTLFTADSGGAAAGGQINIVTKSGTNQFHGALFEYLRNSEVDARGPFDPAVLPPLHRNQFGGNLGGPIRKDKTFFFASYEGLRQAQSSTSIAFVPSQLFRTQIAQRSPALAPFAQDYPKGTSPTSDPYVDQLTAAPRTTYQENSFMGRIDHYFNERTSMYGHFDLDDSPEHAQDALLFDEQTLERQTNFALELQHSFSPSVINEAKFGLNRSAFNNPVISPSPYEIDSPSFTSLVQRSSGDREIGTTFAGIDTLSFVHGRQTFKIGGELRRIRLNQGVHEQDIVSFASTQDFLTNQVDSFSFNSAEPFVGFRRWYVFLYIQDEIRLTPNLTINAGLRHEYYSVPTEAHGRGMVFDLYGCHGFCPPGTPFYSPAPANLDPRIGIAWSPAALHNKTVIRTGFGVYHGDGQNDDLNAPLEDLETRFSLNSAQIPNLSFPVVNFFPLASVTSITPRALQRDRQDEYEMAYGLSIQQQLPAQFVMQVGYFGSEGRQVFQRSYVNVINPATGKRFLPNYGQIDIKYNEGTSNYNALQVSLQRRFFQGWLWNLQYAWSHSLNEADVGGGEAASPQNVNCAMCDYGNSPDDVRHHLVIDSVYDLPFGRGRQFGSAMPRWIDAILGGWQLSGLASAHSGLPFSVTVTRPASSLPDGNNVDQRPDYLIGVPLIPIGGQSIAAWLNRGAFAVPAKGTWGDLGRAAFFGPAGWNLDAAIEKSFPITERARLSFRAEAFNSLNHPQYNNPISNISNNAFGRITGAAAARQLQGAARIDF